MLFTVMIVRFCNIYFVHKQSKMFARIIDCNSSRPFLPQSMPSNSLIATTLLPLRHFVLVVLAIRY